LFLLCETKDVFVVADAGRRRGPRGGVRARGRRRRRRGRRGGGRLRGGVDAVRRAPEQLVAAPGVRRRERQHGQPAAPQRRVGSRVGSRQKEEEACGKFNPIFYFQSEFDL